MAPVFIPSGDKMVLNRLMAVKVGEEKKFEMVPFITFEQGSMFSRNG
jgi:hypothetical protein